MEGQDNFKPIFYGSPDADDFPKSNLLSPIVWHVVEYSAVTHVRGVGWDETNFPTAEEKN